MLITTREIRNYCSTTFLTEKVRSQKIFEKKHYMNRLPTIVPKTLDLCQRSLDKKKKARNRTPTSTLPLRKTSPIKRRLFSEATQASESEDSVTQLQLCIRRM